MNAADPLRAQVFVALFLLGCGPSVFDVSFPEDLTEREPEGALDVRALFDGDALEVEVIVAPDGTPRRHLWFYSARLAEVPSAMNQGNGRWVFPRERDLAPIAGLSVTVDDVPLEHRFRAPRIAGSPEHRQGAESGQVLQIDVPQNQRNRPITIRYRQRVPERFGRLGRVGRLGDRTGMVSLLAPWYPVPLVENDAFAEQEQSLRLCVPAEFRDANIEGRVDGSVRCFRRAGITRYFPFALARSFEEELISEGQPVRRRRDPANNRSPIVRVVGTRSFDRFPHEDATGEFGLVDLNAVDVPGRLAELEASVRRTLSAAGLFPRPGPTPIILARSRTELAANAPGLVVVSDRAFEVLPIDDLRALHERAIARALFRYHLAPLVREVEPARDFDWALDLRAVLLADLRERVISGEVTRAEDLIAWASFHPAVDQLLYAPQVAFADVLFGAVAEPDPFRDAPARALYHEARGRRLAEHAKDRLAEAAFSSWVSALFAFENGARASLDEAEQQMLAQWLRAPREPVNYRLGEITTVPTDEGAFRHEVEVLRDGERREPVLVHFVDNSGEEHEVLWEGEGSVVVTSRAELDRVQIDPHGRAPQSSELSDGHPFADDSNSHPLRPPVFQGFNLSVTSEGDIVGFLDVAIRRRFDIDNTFSARFATGPRSRGVLLRYLRGVGRKRDNNARVGRFGGGLEGERLLSSFTDGSGAWRLRAHLYATYSDQRFFLDPRGGTSVAARVAFSYTRHDSSADTWSFTPSIRFNRTIPLGHRGAMVLVVGASAAFRLAGANLLPSELPTLGGAFSLRSFVTNGVLGEGAGFAVLEFRFTPSAFSNLHLNAVHIAWVRELQLAAFVGTGVLLRPYSIDVAQNSFGVLEAGGGLRIHFDYGGIQPALLSLDVAVPLSEATRTPTFVIGVSQFY